MFVRRAVVLRFLSPWKRQVRCSPWPPSAPLSVGGITGKRSLAKEEEEEDIGRRLSTAADAEVLSTPDFYNTRVIYGAKSNWEILRSYFVFSLCSVDFIVDRQAKILSWMRRLMGRNLFVRLIEKTIFGQFMVSDDPSGILDLARRHSKSRISPLFAYTAAEFHGTHTGGSSSEKAQIRSAKDAWCQRNFDTVLRGIEMASRCAEFTLDKPVVTTKLTFLTDFAVLRHLSEAISQQTKLIETAMIDSCQKKDPSSQRSFIEYLTKELLQPTTEKALNDLSQLAPPGQVSSSHLSPGDHELSTLLTSIKFHLAFNQSLHEGPLDAATEIVKERKLSVTKLSREEIDRILGLWDSMTKLNQRAAEHDVIVNYDAEQTFIQPAIESLVLDSMRVFNRHQPLVLNTYQCYLKRTVGVLRRDLKMSDLEGFAFGGKVVRGAYMDEERRLARETNRPDPVNDTYEATTETYNQVLDDLLSRSASSATKPLRQQRVIVATHNLDTVKFVLKRLAERQLDARNVGLSFAQLLGTRDYISFALGAAGYPAGKLIHYANPEDGLAYLSRRVQENRSGLPSPAIERRLLQEELKRRWRPFKRAAVVKDLTQSIH